MTSEQPAEILFPDPPELPQGGHKFRMPDGTVVRVQSSARDHTGLRVNGIYVWREPAPEPEA